MAPLEKTPAPATPETGANTLRSRGMFILIGFLLVVLVGGIIFKSYQDQQRRWSPAGAAVPAKAVTTLQKGHKQTPIKPVPPSVVHEPVLDAAAQEALARRRAQQTQLHACHVACEKEVSAGARIKNLCVTDCMHREGY